MRNTGRDGDQRVVPVAPNTGTAGEGTVQLQAVNDGFAYQPACSVLEIGIDASE